MPGELFGRAEGVFFAVCFDGDAAVVDDDVNGGIGASLMQDVDQGEGLFQAVACFVIGDFVRLGEARAVVDGFVWQHLQLTVHPVDAVIGVGLDGDRVAFDGGFDERFPVTAGHIAEGVERQVGGGVFAADAFEIVDDLFAGPGRVYLDGFGGLILLVFVGEPGIDMEKIGQVLNALLGGVLDERGNVHGELFAVVRFMNIDFFVLHERHQLLDAQPVREHVDAVIIFGDVVKQFFKRLVVNAKAAVVLVAEERFGINEHPLSAAPAAELKMFLVFAERAEEIGEVGGVQVGVEVLPQQAREFLIAFRVDGGGVIEAVDPAGVVGDDGDLFVADGALGLVGDFGAVEPHGPGDEAAVIGNDAVADINEVLGMQGGQDHVDIVQRDAADDKRRGGVQGRQGDTFAGAGLVAVFEAESVHGLDGFGFPVGDDVAFVPVEAEVAADVHVEIVLVAGVAEQGVAAGDVFGGDVVFESRQLDVFMGQAPSVQVEVELVLVHDVLAHPHEVAVGAFAFQFFKRVLIAPAPQHRAHDVGQDDAVHQLRVDENLHIRQRDGGTVFFQVFGFHKRLLSINLVYHDTGVTRRLFFHHKNPARGVKREKP